MLRVRREENGFDRNTQAFEIARQFQRAARAVVREAQELDEFVSYNGMTERTLEVLLMRELRPGFLSRGVVAHQVPNDRGGVADITIDPDLGFRGGMVIELKVNDRPNPTRRGEQQLKSYMIPKWGRQYWYRYGILLVFQKETPDVNRVRAWYYQCH